MTPTAEAANKPKWTGIVRFVLESFGPLIVFVALEHAVSLFAAIVSSIVTGVILVVVQIARDKKISPFTAYIAASVAVFGVLDMKYQTGFFVKIEPAIGNALTGLFFLSSVAFGKPIIAELAQKQRSDPFKPHVLAYLRNLTVAWGLFFFAKAAAYVWMAYRLSIDQALAIRSVAGPASFGAMIAGEWGFRYLRWGKKAFDEDAGTSKEGTT